MTGSLVETGSRCLPRDFYYEVLRSALTYRPPKASENFLVVSIDAERGMGNQGMRIRKTTKVHRLEMNDLAYFKTTVQFLCILN